jgi:serine/threonine protein kinase
VLVTDEGGKLSDLGLARVLTPGVTLTGMAGAASVEYLDPALLRGERPSRATEVFALGATLHRALTGHGLYGELRENEPLLAIRKVMASQPTIAPGLSDEEAALIRACLAPPGERPATALEVAERLEAMAAPQLAASR